MIDDELDTIFKALADRTRRQIIAHLSQRPEMSLFEICAIAVAADGKSFSRQTISQHLDVLEKAGLVKVTWKGRTKAHSLKLKSQHIEAAGWLAQYNRREK